ncbi:septal ring lytic transglycosylase RlpA family protein [Halomonas vilamensis]|uniref:Endolytic peptidoglycan transglycosylase RlpA n=1 Tax=Vreelandella vilamensis TaxID=531309 RepID=A0ABU1H5S8_9GAMM|nr:septal ring lytic transglycosylase RlpA family protein [Halomonas vilamensis]MDR5899660.1 septal ring lytic transglycosylase RlpA family protein [Halomonas vilamensis]
MAALFLSGCASRDTQRTENSSDAGLQQTQQSASSSSGERYAMSGDAYPLDPPDVSRVPNAEPKDEPLSRAGNRSSYTVWGKTYRVLPDSTGYSREGVASWYGEKFHGYATSNGEIYDMYKMTAAHRSLPLPTFARVTSLDNGNSVIVRVNDRGPFHSEREIDLSYAAASRLGFIDEGTGRVSVEAIDPKRWQADTSQREIQTKRETARQVEVPAQIEVPTQISRPAQRDTLTPASTAAESTSEPANEAMPMYLQIAALGSAESADRLKQQLQSELDHNVRITSEADVYRVQVGPIRRQQDEQSLRESLRQAGFPQAFIVK